MSKKKRIWTLILTGAFSVVLAVIVIFLIRTDNPLDLAARNSNTIKIVATYNYNTQTLDAIQVVDYKNRTNYDKNEIKFHIYANAYKENARFPAVSSEDIRNGVFPNGPSFGGITIKRVAINRTLIQHVMTGYDDTVLKVPLASTLRPGQSLSIQIDYVVQLANIAHRLGFTDRVVNLGNFYPVPVIKQNSQWLTFAYSYNGDPFFNDLHNFNVTLTKPDRMIMASSGIVLREGRRDGMRTTVVQSRAIRDWAAVLSPYFNVRTRTVDRVIVSYFYLDDADPNRSLSTSVRAKQTFSRLFVPFPYRTLNIVQTDFLHGGMEYGELVYISTSITSREEIDRVIIHEIAHQWWYGIIGNDQARHSWLDEGLAEFSTLLFFDENPGWTTIERSDHITAFRNNLATFTSTVRSFGMTPNLNMSRDLHAFNSTPEYIYVAYVRGFLLFADLESWVGPAKMRSALQNLAKENKFGIITPNCLIRSFENTTNLQLGLFFDHFLRG